MSQLYLDSNLLYPYFEAMSKGQKEPKVFRYLYNKRRNYEYWVSTLTKIEIFRHLHNYFNVSEGDCQKLWEQFKDSLRIKVISIEDLIKNIPNFFEEIATMVCKRPTGKNTIINIIHTKIARETGMRILTGDEKLKERFKVFYPNIITYKELRSTDISS